MMFSKVFPITKYSDPQKVSQNSKITNNINISSVFSKFEMYNDGKSDSGPCNAFIYL